MRGFVRSAPVILPSAILLVAASAPAIIALRHVQLDVPTAIAVGAYLAGMVALAAWVRYRERRSAFSVRFYKDGDVEFGRPCGPLVIPSSSIMSITRRSGNGKGPATLLYAGGALRVLTVIEGWHEVLARLRALNSAIDIRGF